MELRLVSKDAHSIEMEIVDADETMLLPLHQKLMDHPEYRVRFGDRAHQRLFQSGRINARACH